VDERPAESRVEGVQGISDRQQTKSFNQNLRLLHAGKYSPRIDNKPWSRLPRTLMANGDL